MWRMPTSTRGSATRSADAPRRRAGRGFLREMWPRLRRDRAAAVGLVVVVLVVVMAAVGPLVSSLNPTAQAIA